MENIYKRKRKNSYSRKKFERRKLKKLLIETQHRYGAGAYFDQEKNRIIRYKTSIRAYRYWKKFASKKARRFFESEDIYKNKGFYKKVTDIDWIIN